MGQNQSNKGSTAKTVKKQKPQESDESEDDDIPVPNLVNEAETFIIVDVRFEKPDGQVEKKQFSIGTSKSKAEDVKRKLEQKFGIRTNKIQVYLDQMNEEIPDKRTLHELGIINDAILRVRDGSLSYN